MFTWDSKQCLQECTQLSKHYWFIMKGHHQAFIVNQ